MKKWICRAASFLLLAALILPGQTAKAEEAVPAPTQPAFQNPHGMTVDLIYYTLSPDGSENIVKKAERNVISAGTGVITLELQEQLLPKGYQLKEARELPLAEDTLEVKILVVPVSGEPALPEEKPTEPAEKPTEPEAKPTEPEVKPTEKPTEPKPTEPKPTEPKPTEKPTETKPQKPQKPSKPAGKPDPSNPQTGDSFPMGLWLSLGIGSAAALLLLYRRKAS